MASETTVNYHGISFCVKYEYDKGEKPDYGDGGHPGQPANVIAMSIWIESDPKKSDIRDLLDEAYVLEIEALILHGVTA
jgi:hypothetical protein